MTICEYTRYNVLVRAGHYFPIDIYGHGPHAQEIQEEARKRNIPVRSFNLIL